MAVREPCHAETHTSQRLDISSPSFSVLGPSHQASKTVPSPVLQGTGAFPHTLNTKS